MGRQSDELVTIIGHARAFQLPINDNMVITRIGDFESGITTLQRKRRCPAPSIPPSIGYAGFGF